MSQVKTDIILLRLTHSTACEKLLIPTVVSFLPILVASFNQLCVEKPENAA